jgi:hypothetical protein
MFLGAIVPIPRTHFEIVNNTNETLYITPVDRTPGRTVVIEQQLAIKQRDVPLHPNSSVMMIYYGELQELSGISVCRERTDCRWATEYEVQVPLDPKNPLILLVRVYTLNSFEELPKINADLLLAIQSHRQYSFQVLLWLTGILIPIILFLCWLYFVLKSRFSPRLRGNELEG